MAVILTIFQKKTNVFIRISVLLCRLTPISLFKTDVIRVRTLVFDGVRVSESLSCGSKISPGDVLAAHVLSQAAQTIILSMVLFEFSSK